MFNAAQRYNFDFKKVFVGKTDLILPEVFWCKGYCEQPAGLFVFFSPVPVTYYLKKLCNFGKLVVEFRLYAL
jgi:hypothetical protein